jgi:radical SAM protein with 4Fe4S-binding SPASM domain
MKFIGERNKLQPLSALFTKYSFSIVKRLNIKRIINIIILFVEIKLKKPKLKSRPIIAKINTYPFCNLRCQGCFGNKDHNYSKNILTFEQYKVIIDKISDYLMTVILYDEGEPLLNKDIIKIIKYTNNLNISTAISTNLSLGLSDQTIDDLVLSGLDRLRVALDGMSQSVYEQYRVGGNLSLVKRNLQRILQIRRKHNRKTPVIEIQYLNFGYNVHQLEEAKQYAQHLGVDEFTTFLAHADDFWISYKGEAADRMKLGCSWIWGCLYISNDGTIFPCHYGEDNDMEPIGSIFRNNLEHLWNAFYMQNLRKSFQKNQSPVYNFCQQCPITQTLPLFLR